MNIESITQKISLRLSLPTRRDAAKVHRNFNDDVAFEHFTRLIITCIHNLWEERERLKETWKGVEKVAQLCCVF